MSLRNYPRTKAGSPMISPADARKILRPIIATVGLSVLAVWSDLVGHGSGLLDRADLVQDFANARLIFLVGLATVYALHIVAPRHISRFDRAGDWIVTAVSTLATITFAFAESGVAGRDMALIGTSLVVIGIGYGWFFIRFLNLLAHEDGYKSVIYVLVWSAIVKTGVTAALSLFASPELQRLIAVLSAPVMLLCFRLCRSWLDAAEHTPDLMELPKDSGLDKGMLYALVAIIPTMHALTRALGNMGFWGSEYEAFDLLSGLEIVVVATLVVVLARYTLVEQARSALAVRFLPPLMVMTAGLIFSVQPLSGVMSAFPQIGYPVFTFFDLFSQLFDRLFIVVAVRAMPIHPYRVQGAEGLVYTVAAIAFAAVVQMGEGTVSLLVNLVFLVLIGLAALALWRYQGEYQSPSTENSQTLSSASSNTRQIAESYGLSPREAEVFDLLVHGRSRSFIQAELFMAEGTVKTHVSHIYRKLGVANKQEMISLVQALGEQCEERR